MFHQLNRVQKPLARPASTTVVFRFIGGQERMHRFPGIQGGWRLDLKLDALMDEMDENTVMSPISIIREHPDGRVKTEDLRIYNPNE